MIAISGSSSTAHSDVRRKVVDFLAVLGSDNRSSRRAGISSDSNTILTKNLSTLKNTYLENDTNNSSSSTPIHWLFHVGLGSQSIVTKAVVKVESTKA